MSSWKQIGTVQLLADRCYAIDAGNDSPLAAEAMVPPGSYPVYRKSDAVCWVMTGELNERVEKLGDGMFGLNNGDVMRGLEVKFPSRIFGIDEFRELLSHPVAVPGPSQRLVFEVTDV